MAFAVALGLALLDLGPRAEASLISAASLSNSAASDLKDSFGGTQPERDLRSLLPTDEYQYEFAQWAHQGPTGSSSTGSPTSTSSSSGTGAMAADSAETEAHLTLGPCGRLRIANSRIGLEILISSIFEPPRA
jgi:hypothetical protein